MIKELDSVVLTVDLPEHRLQKGDIGTVVLLHQKKGYEVEFMTLGGTTLAVISLTPSTGSPGRKQGNRPGTLTLTPVSINNLPNGSRLHSIFSAFTHTSRNWVSIRAVAPQMMFLLQ